MKFKYRPHATFALLLLSAGSLPHALTAQSETKEAAAAADKKSEAPATDKAKSEAAGQPKAEVVGTAKAPDAPGTAEDKQPASAKTPTPAPAPPPVVPALMTEQENAFALRLGMMLAKNADDKNLANAVTYPGGVVRLLRALGAGAVKDTAAEIRKTLGVTSKSSGTPLSPNTDETSGPIRKSSALWADSSFPILPGYLEAVRSYVGSEANVAPLGTDPESARKTINGWVEEKTQGRLKDLLTQQDMQGANLVLTDAVFFKDSWKNPFEVSETGPGEFTLADGSKRNTLFLHARRVVETSRTELGEVLSLPFADPALRLVCILPAMKKGESPGAALLRLERDLGPGNLKTLLKGLQPKDTDIRLPKIDFSGLTTELVPVLQTLGIKKLFSDECDLSAMSEKGKELKVGVFKQIAGFKLDEQGAEASAGTAAVVTLKGGGLEKPAPPFHANRPCLFLVQRKLSGAIEFFVRCASPDETKAN